MKIRMSGFIFLLLAMLFAFLGQRKPDHSDSLLKYSAYLNNQLKSDSNTIVKYYNSAHDKSILANLDDSPFYIEVFSNDTIAYWNDRTSISENSIERLFLLTSIRDSSNVATISLNTCRQNSSSNFLGYSGQEWTLSKNAHQSVASELNVGGQTFMATADDDTVSQIYRFLAWLFLSSLTILLCWTFLDDIKAGLKTNSLRRSKLFSLIMLLFIYGILHFMPVFYKYFGWAVSGSGFISGSINIFQLITFIWIFGYLISVASLTFPETSWHIKYTAIYCWFTGFYTFFIFGLCVHIIETWVIHSPVNLEIEALLQFNGLSFLVILCFFLLMVLVFQSTQLLYEWLHETELKGFYKMSLIATGWLGAYALLKLSGWMNIPEWIFAIFIIAYVLILDAYTEKREKKITYLIWWLMMFSGFLAITLFYFGLKKDIDVRKQFISNYFTDFNADIVSAMETLNDSLVKGDVFTRIASLETPSKFDMKDLNDYIFKSSEQKINFSLELFDKQSGVTLFNNHFADYYKLNQSYINARKAGRNIYHNPFENRYFSRFEIARSFPDLGSWYLYIIYKPSLPQATSDIDNLPDFGFAVFNHEKLIDKKEGSVATPEFSNIKSIYETSISNGYSYVVSIPSDQYRVISWKKVSGLIKPISLFSFIFTLSGLLLVLLTFINTKYDFLPENFSLKFGSRSSLKTKIQLAIILLIVVTFLIIGLITGIYFKNLILANQKSKNNEETESILNNINSDIQNIEDSEYGINYLSSKLKDLSYIHNKDLSLHDGNGKLLASTSARNNLLRIPFDEWNGVVNGREISAFKSKTLYENQEYVPLYLGENLVTREKPFAFIGIDHKTYNSSANILDFLSTILNAYIFLFLIAGAIAITIANSITQPLSILAEKLKKFKLGKTNELLEWKSNDEIGTLIDDYNNLTQELDRSAGLLAKTERDMAWREMAKQVAHEIKNPLTPMKLSIQYLDRAAKDNPEKAQELIPRISSTLIEQIDNLSQIANEFSNFAAMPQASNEKIILNEIVETIHDLFRKREDMEINMIEPIDDLYVFADKNHLVRILNNLLKNAIQAIPENRRGKIEIELKRVENDAIIRISDNGTGIPDSMKDKVFTPNFTTKSSGTGLGLAISANMIDSFNGRIYFETKVGNGTDFYVSIPLMRLDDYISDENRVSLD
ncbi:MAG: HAMP domain-containing histidine kinase [Saprospiraceae bacterium]|nr:HAMP domain-containing histidine kinase [Saprospiraceae bacterium]